MKPICCEDARARKDDLPSVGGSSFNFPPTSLIVVEHRQEANPHFSPGSRMLAKRPGDWTPRWNETHSRRYGLSEAQVQAFEIEPGPG